ncbi:MAG TPA: hypothetical protein DCZ43_01370 [candidate division Zixibacteria bacterium]|nr:hypothetical protein [candidate division Zixibacteria bacterium]
MKIQKPTVLDAARISSELKSYIGAFIERMDTDSRQNHLNLILKNPDAVLSFIVEKKYAYLGLGQAADIDSGKMSRVTAGYSITGASQLGDDRIVELELEREDRLGRKQSGRLIFEIIPNKGNALLVDDSGAIKWSMNKKDGHYQMPPKLKKPTILNFEISSFSTIEKPEQIADEIYGLSERDLINLQLEKCNSIESAFESLRAYAKKASKPGPAWVVLKDNEAIGYSLLSPILQPDESAAEYSSALELYAAYYLQAAGQTNTIDRLESLQKILDKEIVRERGKISSIQKELENAEAAQTFRRYGELILNNIDQIKKGTRIAHLQDLESSEKFNIELDPAKSAAANAEEYFKRSKKAASSFKVLNSRLENTRKRLAQLENAQTLSNDDMKLFETELIKLGLIIRVAGPAKRKIVERRLPYKRFRASSGWEIWVGRANTDNDELTFKIARKDDYWFHAWQAAGSHTVLRIPERSSIPDKQTLLEAAALAAYFSKARTSSKVPVAYTQVKFVHKPKNFPPGKVLVDKEKQLMVRPADPDDFLIKNEDD